MAMLPQIRFLNLAVFNQGHAFGASLFHLLSICTGLRKLTLVLHISSNLENIGNFQYAMEGFMKLPCLTSLAILPQRNGHTFGASLFHVLRMCGNLRKLVLLLLDLEEPFVCPSGCVCDHLVDWKTEELTLNCLQEVTIDMEGTDHQVAFVKRLFTCAVVLKRMQITFDPSMVNARSGNCVKRHQAFLGQKRVWSFTCITVVGASSDYFGWRPEKSACARQLIQALDVSLGPGSLPGQRCLAQFCIQTSLTGGDTCLDHKTIADC